MAMSKEQHEQLIAEAVELESSGPIAPAPAVRAPPPPPPTLKMQQQQLFPGCCQLFLVDLAVPLGRGWVWGEDAFALLAVAGHFDPTLLPHV